MFLAMNPFDILPTVTVSRTRPRVSAKELADKYVVTMSAPGVKTDDIAVSAGDGHIHLEATLRKATDKTMQVSIDGLFGPRTIRAVQSFLKQMGLDPGPIDGYFGSRTVKAVQEFLILREYDVGPTDGIFGRRSARAMQQWLKDVDVVEEGFAIGPIDGIFGPRSVVGLQATLNALQVPAEHDATFKRSIELPREADLNGSIRVTHEDGVLNVVVAKVPSAPTRQLTINADNVAVEAKSDDAALVDDTKEEKHEAEWETVVSPEEDLKAKLAGEGVDAAMVDHLLELHGADADACFHDLEKLRSWESAIADLVEMGLADLVANQKALLKHEGSVKAVVKELVSARAAAE